MGLTLHVDGQRWRSHLLRVAEQTPGLVPVVKGNGYGFEVARLARRTQWLRDHGHNGDLVAVGTYEELPHVSQRCDADLLVLTPWRPFGEGLRVADERVIHTVSRYVDGLDLLERQPRARFVVERLTGMRRHGMGLADLRALASALGDHPGARLEGMAIHLGLNQGSNLSEAQRLINDLVAAGLPTRTVFVSHLTPAELAELRASHPDFTLRPRIGTALWLGDRGALRVTASVLDVHPVERGQTYGYRGRGAPRDGHLVIVSGGTAHGIGLEAPVGDTSVRARARTLAKGGLDAAGFVRSPFAIDGKQRLFAEPPHMQASMLFVPAGARVPAVGDELDVRVRYTTTTFDRVEVS